MSSVSARPAHRDPITPGTQWDGGPANDLGWSQECLTTLARELADGRSTALMLAQSGRVLFQWGEVARKSSVASVRKSLIGILYGIHIAEGRIDPAATLAQLGIDDDTPLTPAERQATVLDLLRARSGVYLPSVYDTAAGRPPRGSHAPGSHWFYNNWDFNVLGTILERGTGRTVPEALAARVATPLGMQDVAPGNGWLQHGPQSRHPVYKLRLSARDLARVGLLYLRGGRWGTSRIVPESWVCDSTRPWSDLGGGRGYGQLWWTAAADAPGDALSAPVPLFYASGFGGQYVIVLPAYDLVVVHQCARVDHGISHARMGAILQLVLAAIPGREPAAHPGGF